MIGKGKSIAHTRASIAYGMKKEKQSEVIYKNCLVGEQPKEIAQEFRIIQEQNQRCSKNTLSFVLSPTIEDGKRLHKNELQEITKRFMEQMKLQERQAIAFVHRNREHTHIHLYVNRIDFNGQAYKDNFIGKRSQQAAEKVAQDLGLKTVREVQQEKLNELKQIRSEIKAIHDKVFSHIRPKSFDQYIQKMKQHEVTVKPYVNRQGQLQGFRFAYKGYELKGSAVHRSMSMGKIGEQIRFDRSAARKIQETQTLKLLGKTLTLSPNLAASLAKKAMKMALKRVLDKGIGIEIGI